MSSLKENLDQLTSKFVDDLLAAVRVLPLTALAADVIGYALTPGPNPPSTVKPAASPRKIPPSKNRRLERRSASQITGEVAAIAAILRGAPNGMRAEEIKKLGGYDVREMPRILREGVRMKVFKKKGAKRATVYSYVKPGGKK